AIVSRSVLTVSRTTTVKDAVELMASAKVGSVIVVAGDRLAGIFSERDVMLRVVLENRDPKKTTVEEVMTTRVHSISMRTSGDEALRIMVQEHIRHLPVVDEQGRPQAIVSMRDLLEEKVKELHQQLDSLESYMSADGIGGEGESRMWGGGGGEGGRKTPGGGHTPRGRGVRGEGRRGFFLPPPGGGWGRAR